MSKDLESKDLDALQLDEDPEENWEVEDDWEDDDFVDIDLDSGRTSEKKTLMTFSSARSARCAR